MKVEEKNKVIYTFRDELILMICEKGKWGTMCLDTHLENKMQTH